MKTISLVLAMLIGNAIAKQDLKPVTIWMIGDSTMSKKEIKAYPETGWGMPFVYFWDSTIKIENRAVNGRSTRSFLYENRWQPVVDSLKPGDYVFIQFGHNDESKEKGERYTTPEQYSANLKKFVDDTRAKKAIPVLITPVARRRFDDSGHVKQSHAEYSPLVRKVAEENNVVMIDLDAKSMALYAAMGAENSKLLFNQLLPGEHPNYPDGKKDDTHFNELGARKIAQIVLAEIREKIPELAMRVKKK